MNEMNNNNSLLSDSLGDTIKWVCVCMNFYECMCWCLSAEIICSSLLNGCTHTHFVIRAKGRERSSCSGVYLTCNCLSKCFSCSSSLLKIPWFSLSNCFAAAGCSKSASPSATHLFTLPLSACTSQLYFTSSFTLSFLYFL